MLWQRIILLTSSNTRFLHYPASPRPRVSSVFASQFMHAYLNTQLRLLVLEEVRLLTLLVLTILLTCFLAVYLSLIASCHDWKIVLKNQFMISNNQMNITNILRLIVFGTLLILCLTTKIEDGRKKVILSDHYDSKNETTTNYLLDNVELNKPLVLILKKEQDHVLSLGSNPIIAKLESKEQTKQCSFNNSQSLCVIQQVKDSKMTLSISCQSLPCHISWQIFQIQTNQLPTNDSTQIAQGLFTLQEANSHVIARIFCNNPQIKQFGKDVSVYSTSHFKRGGSSKQIYIMFTNEQKGYIYFDIKDESLACVEVKLTSVPTTIPYSFESIIDFTTLSSPSSIFLSHPQYDIRIDCLLHMLHLKQPFESQMNPVKFILSGKQNDTFEPIQMYEMTANKRKDEMAFSITFKHPPSNYSELRLDITTKNTEMVIIDFAITDNLVQEISLAQYTYFQLAKGQSLEYSLLPVEGAKKIDKITIKSSIKEDIKLSRKECPAFTGCKFNITAIKSVKGHLLTQSKQKKHQIQFKPIQRLYKGKGKMLEIIYLKKSMQNNKSFRVNINTPNAIMYASSSNKCQLPGQNCSQRTGNIHRPILYTPEQNGSFLLAIQLLENCQFSVTIIEQNDKYISLEEGAPFSYALYEDQSQLQFKFKLKQKQQVSFNLIAPLNTLILEVENNLQDGRQISTEGFITFSIQDLKDLDFSIIVEKNSASKKKQIHFTLIVSTNDTVIQLESSVTHYQTIRPQTIREYVFEFVSSEEYIINFYVHNIKHETVKILLDLSVDRVWNKSSHENIWIDQESDYIDINRYASHLCRTEGIQSCQIFLRLQNEMTVEVDITITLLARNSVIELKDGIWQSYSQNSIANSAHFYFYPKHLDQNVIIIYHSRIDSLKLTYNLWKTDKASISPTSWPFPSPPLTLNSPSVRQVVIDKQILRQKCWPYCVVLLTLYEDYSKNQSRLTDNKDFRIMASNNQIQIPQKTRIEMTLKKGEERDLIVDLKYAMSRSTITFYNTRLFGNYIIFADLYSQKQNRCPLQGKQISDFVLSGRQNIFEIQQLKQRMIILGIQNDTSLYMCLSIKTETNSKFSLEYTTSNQTIKHVHLDSFEEVQLKAKQIRYFQVQGYYDFTVKIMRKNGFPFFIMQQCKNQKIAQCLEELTKSQENGTLIVAKTQLIQQQPCENCIFLFKIKTQEPSSLILHLKSKQSMLELKEHQILTDFMQKNQKNKYFLTHVVNRPLIIDIHILSGDLEAKLSDGNNISLKKSSSKKSKLLHFTVDQENLFSTQEMNSFNKYQSLVGGFQFSQTFRNYILELTNKGKQGSCIFTLVYSSGEQKVFLQDGLITDFTLKPNRTVTLYYNKPSTTSVYLSLSTTKSSDLQQLDIKTFRSDPNDSETKIQFYVEKPKINKDIPSPTLLFQLPPNHYLQIQLLNSGGSQFPISMGINHQEIMFLPLEHDFPFTLRKGQTLNFVVQINQPGFIEASIRKCDLSSPRFRYTAQYDNFIKGQFDSQHDLTDGPLFKETIKISKADSFYLSFQASDFQESRLSINLIFMKYPPSKQPLHPGGNGLIDYQIVQNRQAMLTFMPIHCSNPKCPKKIDYFVVSSASQAQLYTRMSCPSTYFPSLGKQRSTFISKQIKVGVDQMIVDEPYHLGDHIQFLSIKAVNEDGQEVYYKTIEVSTFWGQFSRTSKTHKLTLVIILFGSICALLIFVRYSARKGYVRLQESAQQNPTNTDI